MLKKEKNYSKHTVRDLFCTLKTLQNLKKDKILPFFVTQDFPNYLALIPLFCSVTNKMLWKNKWICMTPGPT